MVMNDDENGGLTNVKLDQCSRFHNRQMDLSFEKKLRRLQGFLSSSLTAGDPTVVFYRSPPVLRHSSWNHMVTTRSL